MEAGKDTSKESPAHATRMFDAREPVTSNEDFVLRYTSQADVLPLGLVFLGILAVLEGKDIVKVCQKLSGEESEYGRDYQVLG